VQTTLDYGMLAEVFFFYFKKAEQHKIHRRRLTLVGQEFRGILGADGTDNGNAAKAEAGQVSRLEGPSIRCVWLCLGCHTSYPLTCHLEQLR
jgi:hypothetical protein